MIDEGLVIAVVVRDRLSMFPRCLEAIYAHTEERFRIVVVAEAADRTSREYLDRLSAQKGNLSVKLVDRVLMQGEARNIALKEVDERYCIILENDTIVHENWLPPLVECMREEEAVVV